MSVAHLTKRIAIGRCAQQLGHGDDAACAGPVLDNDLLLYVLRQFVREQAHRLVADATSAVRHQKTDGLVGIAALGLNIAYTRESQQSCCAPDQNPQPMMQ